MLTLFQPADLLCFNAEIRDGSIIVLNPSKPAAVTAYAQRMKADRLTFARLTLSVMPGEEWDGEIIAGPEGSPAEEQTYRYRSGRWLRVVRSPSVLPAASLPALSL